MKKALFNDEWTFFSDIDMQPRAIRLPHDAMQTEKRIPELKDGAGTGFYPGGFYTYTKKFHVANEELNKTCILEFEGVYMKSSVYLNGKLLGGRIYGYSDFYVELTGKLQPGENELKVIADNSQFANSRWYSGSGIYRDVWMYTADTNYIKPDGIQVRTLSTAPAQIRVTVDARKESSVKTIVKICKDGRIVAEGLGEDVTLDIPEAKLWTAETPELYEVLVELKQDDMILDTDSDSFGIRSIAWDVARGFQVNGKTVKLRGGCVHHDHGFIGAAEFDTACMRRVRLMKEAGFNAVRIAHNPASRAMLRSCDKLGMYVMNETFDTWIGLKSPYDYAMYFEDEWEKDVTDMIRVSYNHPSVIMYSIGNEVHFKDFKRVGDISEKMVNLCHRLDSSRPVTNALNPSMALADGDKENPKIHRNDKVNPRACGKGSALTGSALVNTIITYMEVIMKIFANEKKIKKHDAVLRPLDIPGFNYGTYLYDGQHKDFPNRVLVGSESFPAVIYENWKAVKTMPWVIGDFLWTAWDYLGECGVGKVHYGKQGSFTQPFPVISAGCANIDLTGEITPQGYYCAIVYGRYKKPYLAVHPVTHSGEKVFTGKWRLTDAIHSWSWPGYEGKTAMVDVYANAAKVELLHNGLSLGKKAPVRCQATWQLTYAPGTLEAISYDATGKEIGRDRLKTAGDKNILCVKPETQELKAGGSDLLFIPIEIIDENGIRKVLNDTDVTVQVEGAAQLAGLGNANLTQESLMPYVGSTICTFEGRALAILRSTDNEGSITVTVSAAGMDAVQIELQAHKL